MKFKKVLSICLLVIMWLLMVFCCAVSCEVEDIPDDGGRFHYPDNYVHPDFVTNYTEEYHINYLTNLHEYYPYNGTTIINVELIHAFHDYDCEYFLVEYEYDFGDESYSTYIDTYTYFHRTDEEFDKYRWYKPLYDVTIKERATGEYILGYIKEDNYYYNLKSNIHTRNDKTDFYKISRGISPYRAYGYEDNVKFYGNGIAAVLCDEGIKVVACEGCFRLDVGFELIASGKYSHKDCRVGDILTEEECEQLMMKRP